MLFRSIPQNGDRLSILGFGCMRLPMNGHGAIDEPRATAQLRHAIDSGVNYVDTAWPYHAGTSEAFVGRALSGGYREKVKLATKLPCWLVQNREDMDRYLDTQLAFLQTDHIDYYLLHSLDAAAWERMEQLGAVDFMEKALASGRVRNLGFSFHGPLADFKRVVDAYPWVFCQIQYNYFDANLQAGTEGLRYAASKGLGVMVMQPLRGGTLALPKAPPEVEAIWSEAQVARTPAERALRWVWNQPEVTVALSGMNDEAQAEENLAIASTSEANSLAASEVELIERAAEKYREILKVRCSYCSYCMPCPMGVNIPDCFLVQNDLHLFHDEGAARFVYVLKMGGILGGGPTGYASQCAACNECMEKCPQSLPIPELLADVAAELETGDLREREAMVRQAMNVPA